MITPTLEEIRILSEGYKKIPICEELLSDVITPIGLLKKLKAKSRHTFILESVEQQKHYGRYTFLGYAPVKVMTCTDGIVKIKDLATDKEDVFTNRHPNDCITEFLEQYKSPEIENMPPFTGGLVGYFGYDYIKYSEPKLKLFLWE